MTNIYEYNLFEEGALSIPPNSDVGGPYTAIENEPIVLSAAASSDPDGTLTEYQWDLDNDGFYDNATGITTTLAFFFTDDGTYPIGVKVTDNTGDQSRSNSVVTVANVEPSVTVDLAWQTVAFGKDVASVTITATDIAADPITVSGISWSHSGSSPISGLPSWLPWISLSAAAVKVSTRVYGCCAETGEAVSYGTSTIEIVIADDDGERALWRSSTLLKAEFSCRRSLAEQ